MDDSPPTGTVTFLFTDIEGSTRLLHDVGPHAYAELQAQHRTILREAFRRHSGAEVDTQGDAFFFVFPDAAEAAVAARTGRDDLAAHSWEKDREVRVRMGLHAGTAILTDEGYVGEDIHRAARIAALGAGGQILLSEALGGAIAADPRLSYDLVDLGPHRLKDFERAEHLFQLGDGSFPPIRSLGGVSLPNPASSFVGRTEELYDALGVILDEDPLVFTIHGPGGVGKTRFSIELARLMHEEQVGGTFFIELAPLSDPAALIAEVAETLGLREASGDIVAATADRIGTKRTLLILDNVEHLLSAIPDITRLLRLAPTLRIIATSRVRLDVAGERIFELDPLDLSEAEALFVERARGVGADVSDTAGIRTLCERLDALPLAVELAAARAQTFSTEQLVEAFGDRPELMRGGRDAGPRHSTLVDAVLWSHALLHPDERTLFASLSVFPGSSTWEAIAVVCQGKPECLAGLVDASLVRSEDGAEGRRYFMLETIRSVAADQLEESGLGDEVRGRLVNWVGESMPLGPEGRWALGSWVALEIDNLRAAIRFGLSTNVPATVDLLMKTWQFWLFGGHAEEGDRICQRLLDLGSRLSDTDRCDALGIAGEFARFRGERERSMSHERGCIELAQRLGKEDRVASTLHDLADNLATLGRFDEAWEVGQEALAIRTRLGLPAGIVHATEGLATVAAVQGDWQRSLDLYRDAIGSARADDLGQGYLRGLHAALAWAHFHVGDRDAAVAVIDEILPSVDVTDEADVLISFLELLCELALDHAEEAIVRLLAAVDSLQEWSGLSDEWLSDRQAIERRLKEAHGETGFADAYASMAKCSPEDALELGIAAIRATRRP